MQREFMASPRHNMMMGGNKGHEQYMRTVVDMRYWQGDYMGYESTTAAETHSVTGRSSKVTPVSSMYLSGVRTKVKPKMAEIDV